RLETWTDSAGHPPPARRLPRPALSGVVSAHVAPRPDLRRGDRRLPLVARRGRGLGRTAAEATACAAQEPQAKRGPAGAAAPSLAATGDLYGGRVPGRVAPLPEAQSPRPESGPDARGAAPVRRGRRPLEAVGSPW